MTLPLAFSEPSPELVLQEVRDLQLSPVAPSAGKPRKLQKLNLAQMRAINARRYALSLRSNDRSPNTSLDVAATGHLTSLRMERSLSSELLAKRKKTNSRKEVITPPVSNEADYFFYKQRKAAKAPKGADADTKAYYLLKSMLAAWEESQEVNKLTRSPEERWKQLAALDGWNRIWVHLCKLSFRLMNDRYKNCIPQPCEAALAAGLAEYVQQHLQHFLKAPEDSLRLRGFEDFAYVQVDRVEVLAERAAHAIFQQWSPDFIEEKIRQGWMSSSRGRAGTGTFDSDEARALLLKLHEQGLTQKEIGERFGKSVSTVYRALKLLDKS